MPGSSTLTQLLSNNFDSEDLEYLHQSIKSFFTEPNKPKPRMSDAYNDLENHSNMNIPCFEAPHKNVRLKCKSIENGIVPYCNKQNNVPNQNDQMYQVPLSKSCDLLKMQNGKNDQDSLSNEMIQFGISVEDIQYLHESFNSCLKEATEEHWINKVHWDGHPATSDQERQPMLEECESSNATGSARCEGYSKVNKLLQPRLRNPTNDPRSPSKTFYRKNYRGQTKSLSRDARNDQRRLSTAFETVSRSDLLKLNELKFRKKKLRLGKSEIHGFGLFACEPIGPNEIIIEYVGQLVRPIISDVRDKVYKSSGLGSYCFKVDEDTIIDATNYGSLNRYINHSCDPNSYARILMMENQKKIVIYSKKAIKVDEEITYDYKMPLEDEKIFCLCKAPNCKKTLN